MARLHMHRRLAEVHVNTASVVLLNKEAEPLHGHLSVIVCGHKVKCTYKMI